jgi:gliding motility-associated-like protein
MRGVKFIYFSLILVLATATGFAQTVTTPPPGTIITQSSGINQAYAKAGGLTISHTNSSWPNYYTPCYTFSINDTLFSAINGFNNTPTGGPCSSMNNLVFNPGASNLAAGIVVFTGTTTYRYQNLSSAYVINSAIPVRATYTFSQPVTYYTNNRFVIPVTGNFSYTILFESFSPTNAQYTVGSGNTWTPSVDLFNHMITDPGNSICTAYEAGSYYSNVVQSITSNSGVFCAGNTINLTGGGTGNNVTYTWNGPNSFFSSGANATINNVSAPNGGVYIFTATNDLGCSDTSHVTITINQPPIATAGGTSVICVNSTATVSGASAQNGTINWTHNGSGSLTNANTLTPTYLPAPSDAGNTVVLTLHVTSNNSCAPAVANATFNIIIHGLPIAIDGTTSSGCSTSNINITSATAQFGTILWTHNGTGSLTNATSATPTYSPGPGDDGNTIILTLTVTSTNTCAPSSATAYHFLQITPLPQALAGGSVTICQNSTATVTGASAQYGTYSWSHNGAGTLTNGTTLTPTYQPVAADVGGIVTLTLTVVSNNACAPATSTADYSVIVQGLPIAQAGGSTTICVNSPTIVSGANAQYGSILWTHNGSGSLSNVTSLTPTYTPTSTDAGNTVTLTMTVNSTNSCAVSSATANYFIVVNQLPVATCTGGATICENGSFQVGTAFANFGSIAWTHNGSGTLSNPNSITPTYNAAAGDAGNIVTLLLTVTSNNACNPEFTEAYFNIAVNHLPFADAGGSTTTCMTSSAPVSGVIATYGNIVWTHNGQGNLTNSTSLGPVYQPSANDAGNTVTLTLTVVSTNACAPQTATDTYSIIVDSLPKANVSGSMVICENSNGTVSNATAVYGNPSWSSNGTGILINTNTLSPTYIPGPNEAGNDILLTLTVTSNNTCFPSTDESTFIIHIDSMPVAIVGPQDTICPGGSYILQGASALNGLISWTHNGTGTLLNPNMLNPTYQGTAADAGTTIDFVLTVTSNNSCFPTTATSTLQIYVEPSNNAPTISTDMLNHVSCFGANDGSIYVSIENGAAPFTYNWTPGNITTEDLLNVGPGNYSLTISDNHGCYGMQNFTISEPTEMQISPTIIPADCIGLFGRVGITVTGGTPNYSYLWTPTGDTTNNLIGIASGNYSVQVTDQNGCQLTENYFVGVVGTLNVIATPDIIDVNIGTPTEINVTGASDYTWYPGTDINCDTCSTILITPYQSNVFVVTGTTPNGCVGSDTVTINMFIDCSNLSIPSMFSPNNEGPQENNSFGLLGTYPCIESYQLMIFNRWGEMVFETIDYREQWDGNFKGKPQNSGVFAYRMLVKTIEGKEIKKTGNVTLVR